MMTMRCCSIKPKEMQLSDAAVQAVGVSTQTNVQVKLVPNAPRATQNVASMSPTSIKPQTAACKRIQTAADATDVSLVIRPQFYHQAALDSSASTTSRTC
jgi:hypothetical protein